MSRKESRERERKRRAQLQETVIKDLADLATLPVSDEAEPPADVTTKEDYAWSECISEQKKRYGSQERAEKFCGAIRARYGKSAISVPENIYKEIETELGFNSPPVAQPTPAPVVVKAQPAAFLSDEDAPLPTIEFDESIPDGVIRVKDETASKIARSVEGFAPIVNAKFTWDGQAISPAIFQSDIE